MNYGSAAISTRAESTMRPVIGVSCYVERAQYTVWDLEVALLPRMYVQKIVDAGGQPVLLPPEGDPASLVERLDGLILAGGGDISPWRYSEPPDTRTGYVREFRDDAEFALVQAALAIDLPFLGVCRGMQILNVALGGSLHQHLPDVVGHTDHAPEPGVFGVMRTLLTEGGSLAKILDADEVMVPHYHHQGIKRLGEGLVVTAVHTDGVIEGIEVEGAGFAHGVQWHPEAGQDLTLFYALVEAAKGS
ncbi:gamma-glutamyl-gamma-aminobutyrate hydrolase family protein [Nonomuraea longicatena]|uniref:Gamma-glutamyl-gamma-aminobutyrate hydrolase family protein n=1 Tax=Nonomuraea longicatena TaxID=83682 RepID=A0ABP4BT99_9ACTN